MHEPLGTVYSTRLTRFNDLDLRLLETGWVGGWGKGGFAIKYTIIIQQYYTYVRYTFTAFGNWVGGQVGGWGEGGYAIKYTIIQQHYCRFHFASNMRIACQVLRQELPVCGALRKSHGPQNAGVQKLRALCVSVIFAEHSFRENPRKYACSKRSENDSTRM